MQANYPLVQHLYTRSLVGNDHSAAAGCSSALEASTLGREGERRGGRERGGGERERERIVTWEAAQGALTTTQRASKREREREAGEGTRCLRKRGGWA